mgnify:CR=1 FL=1
MSKMVTLKIDNRQVTAPEGMLIVDAAKKVGINIPVFCYHPKLEPVGMCRMCLVEIGRPVVDRATGQVLLEADGSPRMQYSAKLETACTTPVAEGMHVLTESEKVLAARKEVLEFILTSHPLDCPICDKGGECPLQNLTLGFGPSTSRFLFNEKMHLTKHVPLGELIWLDRERCIQCGRCVRFQEKIAGDPVIGFYHRGRSLEITTWSDPGFDSIFSGNTTDICPVGALTTSDFHFKARPWEMNAAASLCTHCPVGCNLTMNIRREAASGGKVVVKRILPRQNEWVNEIWICDKGRFAHHFSCSPERLTQPLVRKGDRLEPAAWEEALDVAAKKLQAAGAGCMTLAGGRLTNEDLFNLKQFSNNLQIKPVLYSVLAGGDLTPLVGLDSQSNLVELGKGSVILVVASDLHEEAPLWWLRVKQATERGAALLLIHPRPTRLAQYAEIHLRCNYGEETSLVQSLMSAADASHPMAQAVQRIAKADNVVIFCGGEGQTPQSSNALALACAHLLVKTGHIGKPNNGLVMVWDKANTQGAWEIGFRPVNDLAEAMRAAKGFYIAAADPAGDDMRLAQVLAQRSESPLIVQELFLTETAKLADVVFPAQAFTEREGSFTSGERRVQHYFAAVPPLPGSRPDFVITAQIGERLGIHLEQRAAWLVMQHIASSIAAFAGISYEKLGEVREQYPIIGRHDLYYGGASYENTQGLGVKLPAAHERNEEIHLPELERVFAPVFTPDTVHVVPVPRLYDRGTTVMPSNLLHQRLSKPLVSLNRATATRIGVTDNALIQLFAKDEAYMLAELPFRLDESVPDGVITLPLSTGIPIRYGCAARWNVVAAGLPVIE